jgi:hypothetical protein
MLLISLEIELFAGLPIPSLLAYQIDRLGGIKILTRSSIKLI